jgi:hypothetical protein
LEHLVQVREVRIGEQLTTTKHPIKRVLFDEILKNTPAHAEAGRRLIQRM